MVITTIREIERRAAARPRLFFSLAARFPPTLRPESFLSRFLIASVVLLTFVDVDVCECVCVEGGDKHQAGGSAPQRSFIFEAGGWGGEEKKHICGGTGRGGQTWSIL